MERKILISNTLVFILKTLAVVMVLISCGCGGDTSQPPPKEWPKKEQPKITTGSGGTDNNNNPVE
jgi:hypothetical protein